LFVVTEKASQLSLACLRADTGLVLWQQALAVAPTGLLHDPGRRLQAAQPVYGDGVLVCVTHTGIVLGIDLLTRSLLWAYPYRTEALTQSQLYGFRRGRISPPRVTAASAMPRTLLHEGRVIFTVADEPSIHCLNLRDGSLVWKVNQMDDDVYLAGV